MARSRRTRTSRALTTIVVVAIVLGSAFQFHRIKKANAALAARSPDGSMQTHAGAADNAAVTAIPVLAVNTVATPNASAFAPSTRPADGLTPKIWTSAQSAGSQRKDSNATTGAANSGSTFGGSHAVASLVAGPLPANRSEITSSRDALAEARVKSDAGDLIAARRTLNDALLSGSLSLNEADSAKKQIADINQTLVFSSKKFAADPFGGVVTVKPAEKLSSIAAAHDITWELLLRLNNMSDPRKLRAGQSLKVLQGPFHAVVTKSKFTMDIYLGAPPASGSSGTMYVCTFSVGLGRDDSTPTGSWMVEPHHKIKHPTYYSPRGEGVIAADDPKNPLGPFWLGLTGTDGQAVGKASYGIHGTIEPDSIGKMASMGCIRMHNEDVARVFELLVEGKSTVLVRD